MKKIVFALVVLMFAAPAWADVNITAAIGSEPNEVIISFDAGAEANLVRAFGLNVQLNNDANIIEVIPTMVGACTEFEQGYGIFPGTIMIDAQGAVTDDGTPAAEYGDLPSDTLPGPPDGNGVTIELASLYAPVGPGSANAPPASGDLVTIIVDKTCTLCITANVSRAGATGVVMENPDQVVTVNYPLVCLDVDIETGPACWNNPGIALGDGSGDCMVNIQDLLLVKVSWFKTDPDPAYNPCADFNKDGTVNIQDLLAIKMHWFQNVCP